MNYSFRLWELHNIKDLLYLGPLCFWRAIDVVIVDVEEGGGHHKHLLT